MKNFYFTTICFLLFAGMSGTARSQFYPGSSIWEQYRADASVAVNQFSDLNDEHESVLRVLTDAQRSKLNQILSQTPNYLKKYLAELEKNNDSQTLDFGTWQPGMGFPGKNPNREIKTKQRTNERRVPGSEN